MSLLRPHSLQLQLALRLSLLFLAATALAIAALLYQTYRTADSLSNQNLIQGAHDLARSVTTDGKANPRVDLPPALAAFYDSPSETSVFAIRDSSGRVFAASGANIRKLVSTWAAADDEPRFFRLESLGPATRGYYGLDVRLNSAVGPVSVTVAEAGDAEVLLHAMLREFALDVAWIVPVFIAATLLVGILAIRSGLRPLRQVSAQAARIEPSAISMRLPTRDLPTEVVPLVATMNKALDRLEQGFILQRRFTANAAHELRTPLAIITGALDGMNGDGELGKLREDVARMNRLVDQLLRVARLDAVALDVSADVDLGAVAAEVVEYMAPLAIAQDRSLALGSPNRPVVVKGNRHAIADAIRNLVENAIAHTPPRSEVVVEVRDDRNVSVSDRGPGVNPQEREHLFERFWRGKEARGRGAGLGLAIVQEIMKAHGGVVEVSDFPGGGARFTLRFRP